MVKLNTNVRLNYIRNNALIGLSIIFELFAFSVIIVVPYFYDFLWESASVLVNILFFWINELITKVITIVLSVMIFVYTTRIIISEIRLKRGKIWWIFMLSIISLINIFSYLMYMLIVI